MLPNADNQSDDQFGYSCYALVIPASAPLIDKVADMRRQAGMTRTAIPAHVTVKGTFVGIASLDQVKHQVAAITGATAPFFVSFDGAESTWWQGGGALRVPVSPPLQALHDRLVASIAPLGTAAYRDDPYRPHMTYVQDVSPAGLETTKELAGQTGFGPGFMAHAVDLMGRTGPAVGGAWGLIQRFPLAGSA